MARNTAKQTNAPLPAIWELRLEQIPSAYGQLVYLARLLNPDTGLYEDFSSDDNGRAHISSILRELHEKIFRSWVSLPLSHKMADIELYISGLDCTDYAEIIDAWLRLTPYKNLVPATIQGPERLRHTTDFEVILGLLRNVHGVSGPGPS